MEKKLFGKAGVIGFRMENKEEEELTIAQNVPKCPKMSLNIAKCLKKSNVHNVQEWTRKKNKKS